MKRGRKPVPSGMKVIQGNPGKRPIPEEPDYGTVTIGDPPAWLDAAGKKEWKRVAVELGGLEVVAEVDLTLLGGYCDAVARAIEASRMARNDPSFAARADRAWDTVRKFAAVFGIGPAERSRVPKGKKPDSDKRKDFLRGRRGS